MQRLFLIFLILPLIGYGQDAHKITYSILNEKLEGRRQLSFNEAVFLVESSYEQILSWADWKKTIEATKQLVNIHQLSNKLDYEQKDKETIGTYASLFKVLTDTTGIIFKGENLVHLPYRYDFEDIFGSKDWSNMFVSKLLVTGTGNCHSLPFLYKIICEELNVPCKLALAPNHIYIKHRAEKGGMYNTELTSATFPIDAWLMASGYITLEAVQNGIYMDTLSEKESIALCVIDLAQGYDHKYPHNDGKFILECCDLALQHFPDYINAMMLKAETLLRQLKQRIPPPNPIFPSRKKSQTFAPKPKI